MHSSRKIRLSISKNKGRGREKSVFIARYKIYLILCFKFCFKYTRKPYAYKSRLSIKVFTLFQFNLVVISYTFNSNGIMHRETEGHSFAFKSIRSGNVLANTCMQMNILNAQTNFQVSNKVSAKL